MIALQKKGAKGLILIPGKDLIGNDAEATVDGVHLTDLGMYRQAKYLFPIFNKILSEPTEPH